jgi:Tol biopolymer transport system component
VNTKYHESNAVFTEDGKTVYFTRNNYFNNEYGKDTMGWNNLKLFRADVDDQGAWSNVMPLPFNDDNYSVGHPALSPDGRTLYFTSDMPGSMGQTDIFKCTCRIGWQLWRSDELGQPSEHLWQGDVSLCYAKRQIVLFQ